MYVLDDVEVDSTNREVHFTFRNKLDFGSSSCKTRMNHLEKWGMNRRDWRDQLLTKHYAFRVLDPSTGAYLSKNSFNPIPAWGGR